MENTITVQRKISKVKKRDGKITEFDDLKIRLAIKKAFIANGINNETIYDHLTNEVVQLIEEKYDENRISTVEEIQDLIETVLILNKHAKIAKSYILYRSQRENLRKERTLNLISEQKLYITKNGQQENFNLEKLQKSLENLSLGLTKISVEQIVKDVTKSVYMRMPIQELKTLIVNIIKGKIEEHYNYSTLASRMVINELYKDILGVSILSSKLQQTHEQKFQQYIEQGIQLDMLNPELKNFDLNKISKALNITRDLNFHYLGIQTLADRYLLRERKEPKRIYELPQYLWMRVAMGLAIKEKNKEEKAIEFYNALSQFYVISSTPTLFNSGTTISQMSSCFLNIVDDSLDGIFKTYADNAQLCKWAGAVGTDWTPVRAKNAKIVGTNGYSQGTIPFIKIFNDVALAVNQGGKRKGALAAYMEIWHGDIEEFLELKKNTGDERRRAHDVHTAVWIPDLFMKRVKEKGKWTLFSPDTVPELHETYGKKFEQLYQEYEKQEIQGSKTINVLDLWRKILTMLYETGHPWITFKDPCNIRSPQNHIGVVHASNLCTEITLNTNKEETAVCNLASVNLAKLIKDGDIDEKLLEQSVTTAIRMLNNVIDLNYYTIPETKNSNLKHRPIGLGLMGYHDALYQLGIDFYSEENIEFADKSMEMISYHALLASSKLAKEYEPYKSYNGSKWDRGLLPIDTIELLERERGEEIKVNKKTRMNWTTVREHIKQYGMRNSNVMAIAPTATIANIAGVIPCVEPIYKNIYTKENMSGSFIVINPYLIDALEKEGLWNKQILLKIKANNGSVLGIDEIPAEIQRRFKEAFEINPEWVIKAAAQRAKWIDQSASTNLFVKTINGKAISDLYIMAWEYGLKTTYYLRTLAASQVTKTIETEGIAEKQISEIFKYSSQQEFKACNITDQNCESCQ